MAHLAGNRHHDLPGKRRTARARSADGRTRISAHHETLRSDKGRDYIERGGANPAVTFDSRPPTRNPLLPAPLAHSRYVRVGTNFGSLPVTIITLLPPKLGHTVCPR